MRIAQISNNTITVPPKDYGGTQREVYYLTEELLRRGHKVFLFAKKGSTARSTKTFEYPTDNAKEQLAFIKKTSKTYRFHSRPSRHCRKCESANPNDP